MKALLFISQLFFISIHGQTQNDSLKKECTKFIKEIGISPNLCFETHFIWNENAIDTRYRFKNTVLGCGINYSWGIQKRSSIFMIGAGFDYYSFTKYENYSFSFSSSAVESKNTINYKYLFYKIPLRYRLFFEKTKKWFVGLNTEISCLFINNYEWKEIRTISTSNSSYVIVRTNNSYVKAPQAVFWLGGEIGRTLKISKKIYIKASIDLKISSIIRGEKQKFDSYKLVARNIFIPAINISTSLKK